MITEHAARLRVGIVWVVAMGLAGCGGVLGEPDGTEPESADGESILAPFYESQTQPLDPDAATEFGGELEEPSSVDVWELGPVSAGTRVLVDLQGEGNFSLGLFDQDYQVLLINHDRHAGVNVDPYGFLDVSSEDLEALYLGVASDPNNPSSGAYTVRVTLAPYLVEEPSVQHVVLNFEGAVQVSVGNTPAIDVPPFEAADLDSAWSAYTVDIKQTVLQHMRRIYDGLNVVFYYVDDPELPSDQPLTWVHFGAQHEQNVGLADRIDYGNRIEDEKCIVFTQNFAKYVAYGYEPQDLAAGFANVAAHELGHLLGLNHTRDPVDVMNVSPTVQALLSPQYFVSQPGLDPKVFSTGLQDGARGIYRTVGGQWDTVESSRQAFAESAALPQAARVAGDHISIPQLCTAQHCKEEKPKTQNPKPK